MTKRTKDTILDALAYVIHSDNHQDARHPDLVAEAALVYQEILAIIPEEPRLITCSVDGEPLTVPIGTTVGQAIAKARKLGSWD